MFRPGRQNLLFFVFVAMAVVIGVIAIVD